MWGLNFQANTFMIKGKYGIFLGCVPDTPNFTKIMQLTDQTNGPDPCFWTFPQLFSRLKLSQIKYLGRRWLTRSTFTWGRISKDGTAILQGIWGWGVWWLLFNCHFYITDMCLLSSNCLLHWFISSCLWFPSQLYMTTDTFPKYLYLKKKKQLSPLQKPMLSFITCFNW